MGWGVVVVDGELGGASDQSGRVAVVAFALGVVVAVRWEVECAVVGAIVTVARGLDSVLSGD